MPLIHAIQAEDDNQNNLQRARAGYTRSSSPVPVPQQASNIPDAPIGDYEVKVELATEMDKAKPLPVYIHTLNFTVLLLTAL